MDRSHSALLIDVSLIVLLVCLGRALLLAPTELFSLARVGGIGAILVAGVILAGVIERRGR